MHWFLARQKKEGFLPHFGCPLDKESDGGFMSMYSEGEAVERYQSGAFCMVGVTCHITEPDVVETPLFHSGKAFRTVFENSRDALMTILLPEWRFSAVNNAALTMFRMESKDEFTSLAPWDISPRFQPDGTPSAKKARQMADVAVRDRSHCFEWQYVRRDGSEFTAEVMLTCVELNGQLTLYSSVRNISEWKMIEENSRKLRDAVRSLQRRQVAVHTAASIAHELNQPLLAISCYAAASLMLLKTDRPDIANLRHAIEQTERQALRAAASVRELLSATKEDHCPTEAFDLNQEIMDFLAMAKNEHGLAVRTQLRLEPGTLMVQANRMHVQKVLCNLLRNGVEAMRQAGVSLPAITITVDKRQDQNVAQVTVQDNGPGLRREDVDRMFEPFFTTKESGIGMGLCISRSLIEANGGELWANPEEGPGATFHLTLRCAVETDESEPLSLATMVQGLAG